MTDAAKLRTRAATPADASAIAAIYNEGIADRIATFETEPRSARDIAGWFTGEHLVVVAETGETGPVAFVASFPYSSRPCYRGICEFSVYVRRDYRGRRAGRAVLAALIEAAAKRSMHKLTSRVFPENAASRMAHLRGEMLVAPSRLWLAEATASGRATRKFLLGSTALRNVRPGSAAGSGRNR
jgi:phosphinothricin acetyltransferase